jgi:diaminohydroxyphosphoribosylaminopyrimidine deaminase/5-amino-6-(5-phosphoribosylamino)uracil reductase
VGCVLLDKDGALAGEGWHEYDRRDHAEVAALEDAARRGASVRGGTAYVTLEPCNHTGRTGPCSQALIEAGVKRVVIATLDPNPVAKGGAEVLRAAGVETVVGCGEAEARRLNEPFACWSRFKRPLVQMKVAMSLDGRIAPPPGVHRPGQPYWITSEAARAEVQQMRWQADAVVTGVDTILADDPLMTDRSGRKRRRPLVRVVLDSALRLPVDCKLVESATDDVVVFTVSMDAAKSRALQSRGVRVVLLTDSGLESGGSVAAHAWNAGRVPLEKVLGKLGEEGVLSLLTETGSRLNTALLAAGLVDRLRLFISPQIMGSDAVPAFRGLAQARQLPGATVERFGEDLSVEALLRDVWNG